MVVLLDSLMADLPARDVPRAQGGSGLVRLTRVERRRSASSRGSHTVYGMRQTGRAERPGIRAVAQHVTVQRDRWNELREPEAHVHLPVHRRRGGEVLVRLLALARAPVELGEAEVAVGDERAHSARLGEGERLAVVGLAALGVEAVGMGRDIAEQV